MNDSMAQPGPGLAGTDAPGWKSGLSWVSSLLLCALFLLSGLWKITDVQGTAVRMVQAKVPDALGLPAALFFGIVETVEHFLCDCEEPSVATCRKKMMDEVLPKLATVLRLPPVEHVPPGTALMEV